MLGKNHTEKQSNSSKNNKYNPEKDKAWRDAKGVVLNCLRGANSRIEVAVLAKKAFLGPSGVTNALNDLKAEGELSSFYENDGTVVFCIAQGAAS